MPERRRHPKGAPASQGGRFAPMGRPEGTPLGPAPLSGRQLHILGRALLPADPRLVRHAFTSVGPEEATRAVSAALAESPGPAEDASLAELRVLAHPGQDPVVLYEVLDHDACTIDLALEMLDPGYPASVRAEVVRQGWQGAARRTATDPHPLVRALAMGAWDLDDASAQALRADVVANHARAALFGPDTERQQCY